MTEMNSTTQLPFYVKVDPNVAKSLEREFTSIQETMKLFMLKYTDCISTVYKNKLDDKILVNPKLDCFQSGFNCLLYNMKKKFMKLMKEELGGLKDFFYEFVNLKEKDYIFGKLFKKNFQDEFCLDNYPADLVKKMEVFLAGGVKQVPVAPQAGNVKDFEVVEASEMSHLEFDQSPHSTMMAKEKIRKNKMEVEKNKLSPKFAHDHDDLITPKRNSQKSPSFYKRAEARVETQSDLENTNPNIEKIYQPINPKGPKDRLQERERERERSKEKMIPRLPKPPLGHQAPLSSAYKDIEPQSLSSVQRSPKVWEQKKCYSNNPIKPREVISSHDFDQVKRNDRYPQKDKNFYQNAGKSRRSREKLQEEEIEKYAPQRRSKERISRRFMDQNPVPEPEPVQNVRKFFDVIRKNLGQEEGKSPNPNPQAVLAFEVIDEETIVYSILDQGIFLDKFTVDEDEEEARNYKILISERKRD